MNKRRKILTSIISMLLIAVIIATISINVFAGSGCTVSVQGIGNYVAPRASAMTKATIAGPVDGDGLGAANSYCDAFVYLYWSDTEYYSDYATADSGTFYSPEVAKWVLDSSDVYSYHYGRIVYKGRIEQEDSCTRNN